MENQQEIWKDIPGFEGYYQASTLGRIKSLSRVSFRATNGNLSVKEKILKQSVDNGYYKVQLCSGGRCKPVGVHIILAICFLNHKPAGITLVVDHIDNNSLNNSLDNLQVVTQRENASKDRKNKTSQYTGVHWNKIKNKWHSQIRLNGKKVGLGLFSCEHEAGLAYKKALETCSI